MRGLTKISPVATGGIVAFHPLSLAVRLRDSDRLCDSLIPIKSGIVSLTFRSKSTCGYPTVLAHSPLHSVVWTFLSDLIGARVRIPMYYCIVPHLEPIVKIKIELN